MPLGEDFRLKSIYYLCSFVGWKRNNGPCICVNEGFQLILDNLLSLGISHGRFLGCRFSGSGNVKGKQFMLC